MTIHASRMEAASHMKRSLWIAGALLLAASALAVPPMQKARRPKTPPARETVARPKQQNQFVTVEEFRRSGRPPKTAVSVEGYFVLGYRAADGGLRLMLTDSVDHVLSAQDADRSAASSAVSVVPSAALKRHPRWAWSAKGMQRFVMYIGPGRAQRLVQDIVAKMRVTGWTAPGRAIINPVTQIEFQDANGEWKTL